MYSTIDPGNTPFIKVDGIYAKLECCNPCGSVKDRIGKYILDESEERGLLKLGMTIVEATSGNTGISFSYYGRGKGYNVTIIMPENMTEERKRVIKDLGADLVLCSPGDFKEAKDIRNEMSQDPHYFNPDQFSNPLNVECHYRTTGQEILRQMKARPSIDAFVAGVGTGGTLIGVAKALKEIYPEVYIAAVEPSESPVMSGGKPGPHGIPGIGDGSIPDIVSGENGGLHKLIDEVIRVSSNDAKNAAQEIDEQHGFCVGISSGANYVAGKELSERFKTVVTVFPDGFPKYKSRGLKQSEKGRCPYEMDRIDVLSGKNNCGEE